LDNMKFYHFLEDANIHVLDYSGRVKPISS